VYKWFPGNEGLDNKITRNGTVTTYSKLAIITEQGHQSDKFHVMFADADDCDMDEESMRRLLCSSGTLDGARGLINRDAWPGPGHFPTCCLRHEAIPKNWNGVQCDPNSMSMPLW